MWKVSVRRECEKWVGKVYLHNVLAVFGLVPCHPTPNPFSTSPLLPPLFSSSIPFLCLYWLCFLLFRFLHTFLSPRRKICMLVQNVFALSLIVLLLLKSLLNCAENNVETVRHIQIYTHSGTQKSIMAKIVYERAKITYIVHNCKAYGGSFFLSAGSIHTGRCRLQMVENYTHPFNTHSFKWECRRTENGLKRHKPTNEPKKMLGEYWNDNESKLAVEYVYQLLWHHIDTPIEIGKWTNPTKKEKR